MALSALSLPFRGDVLRKLREEAGLSQTALAARCTKRGYSVHLSAISKVELGRNRPSPGLLKALAEALGVEVRELLDGDGKASA